MTPISSPAGSKDNIMGISQYNTYLNYPYQICLSSLREVSISSSSIANRWLLITHSLSLHIRTPASRHWCQCFPPLFRADLLYFFVGRSQQPMLTCQFQMWLPQEVLPWGNLARCSILKMATWRSWGWGCLCPFALRMCDSVIALTSRRWQKWCGTAGSISRFLDNFL